MATYVCHAVQTAHALRSTNCIFLLYITVQKYLCKLKKSMNNNFLRACIYMQLYFDSLHANICCELPVDLSNLGLGFWLLRILKYYKLSC
jgi:hypothetical protein